MRILFADALQKVFLDEAPKVMDAMPRGFLNETISFQLCFCNDEPKGQGNPFCEVTLQSDIAPFVRLRRVVNVPVGMPAYCSSDDDFLRKTPGLYPDMLVDLNECRMRAYGGLWQAVWVDVDGAPAGVHTLCFTVAAQGEEPVTAKMQVEVLPAKLPEIDFAYTRWLHCDAICAHYHTEFASERFWEILDKVIACAAKRGINAILTPIHTPPLDTAVGGERLTTQLVDVSFEDGKYVFGFEKLHRFTGICKAHGVRHLEMAHLFSQWGAKCTPKIVVRVNGKEEKRFGWHVSADSEEYRTFLAAYIPAVKAALAEDGMLESSIWHISDEPNMDCLESYRAAKESAAPYLKGMYIADAISNVDFYKLGVVDHPIPANDHVMDFIDEKVEGLWTYYCCGQDHKVSNQFIAMPSRRTRILGVQMYKYGIKGFLHWGLNFGASQNSEYMVDVYGTTDADGFVPGGDPGQIYPGKDGEPLESIRLLLTQMALNDMRALTLLETYAGRAHVLALIDEGLKTPITFAEYPRTDAYLKELRCKVEREIMAKVTKS